MKNNWKISLTLQVRKSVHSEDKMLMKNALEEHDSCSLIGHNRFWQCNKLISSKRYGLDFGVNRLTGINLTWQSIDSISVKLPLGGDDRK